MQRLIAAATLLALAGLAHAVPTGEAGLVYREAKQRFGDMREFCALSTADKRQRLMPIILELASARKIRSPFEAGTEAGAFLRGECEQAGGAPAARVDPETLRWITTGLPALSFAPEARVAERAPAVRELSNRVFLPPGNGPHALVVIGPTMGSVSEHLRVMAGRLLTEGFGVLVVDSYGPRNVRPGTLLVPAELVRDAYDALKFSRTLSAVDPARIYYAGYSLGGMAAAMLASPGSAQAFSSPHRFRAMVAHYGACTLDGHGSAPDPASQGSGIVLLSADSDQPLLALMGELDIETPPDNCLPVLQSLKDAGRPVQWHVYPGTTHGWDKAENNGYVFRDRRGRSMAYRHDPAVTDDATRRTIAFFNEHR